MERLHELSMKNTPHESETLFDMRENSAAEMAWACTVYAMVPYLGIIFTPCLNLVEQFNYYEDREDR